MDDREFDAMLKELRSPAGLNNAVSVLQILEAAGRSPKATVEELEQILLDSAIKQSVIDDLVTVLAHWPIPKPEQQLETWDAWLRSVEQLGLAMRGLERLRTLPEPIRALEAGLGEVLRRIRAIVESRPDKALFAGLAEEAIQSGLAGIEPWSWLHGGELVDALLHDSKLLEPALGRWVAGTLHSADARDLRMLLEAKEEVREAYCRLIRQLTNELHVTRWNPRWSLDVAASTEEIPSAHRLLFLLLPHSNRRLDVRQHREGTWWSFSEDVLEGELVPLERDYHVWQDELLGEIKTSIRVQIPSPEVDVWHGLSSLRSIASGDKVNRATEIAEIVAEDLESGILGKALEEGYAAFEEGFDTSALQEQLVSYGLEARLLLSQAALRLAIAGRGIALLSNAVRRADEAHRDHGEALHLIDERTYQRIVEDIPLDQYEWWGARERLDRRVPPGVVETALNRPDALRKSAEIIRFPTSQKHIDSDPSLVRLAAAAEGLSVDLGGLTVRSKRAQHLFAITTRLGRIPCPWLHTKLRDAVETVRESAAEFAPTIVEMMGPSAGRVPILLYQEASNSGFVGELWIKEVDEGALGDMWHAAPQLMTRARGVIRRAFYATASHCPYGAPPRAFGDHSVEVKLPEGLVTGDALLEIDGPSLGLAAAMAFASLWIGRPIPSDVAATATICGNNLGPVYGMAAKAKALIGLMSDNKSRLLCHPMNEEDASSIGVPVNTLEEALIFCGLNLDEIDVSLYGSVSDRKRELQNLLDDVQTQHLNRYRESTTWLDIGDRMRRLISSIGGQPGAPSSLDEHRCYAALAYMHAGDVDSASTLMRSVSHAVTLPLALRALNSAVSLGAHIDLHTLGTEAGQAEYNKLKAIILELRGHDSDALLGRCVGTLGRALVHQYRSGEALPFLRDAVEQHGAQSLIYERARSRIYLAMALRMNGQAEEALDQVRLAETDLEEHTKPFSYEYASSCRMYLFYEKARTLISLGRLKDALQATDIALHGCKYLWWPQLGILRTRAWALRGMLREKEANQCVERMLDVKRDLDPPDQLKDIIDELIIEAKEDRIEDGQVY